MLKPGQKVMTYKGVAYFVDHEFVEAIDWKGWSRNANPDRVPEDYIEHEDGRGFWYMSGGNFKPLFTNWKDEMRK